MAALALGLVCECASAADDARDMFTFNGFGTVSAVHSSEAQADFTATSVQPEGAGYTQIWSANPDTRLGAQLTGRFTPQLSAVLQLVAQQNYRNSYQPSVEWANLIYKFSSEWNARIGRFELPTFMVSDFRQVGYANPWVRPPVEMYGQIPVAYSDGAQISYTRQVGEYTNTLLSIYSPSFRLNTATARQSEESSTLWGFFDRSEYRDALVSITYFSSDASLEPPLALFDAFRQFGPQGETIADHYQLTHKRVSILSFGASYDPGKWFAMSEWSQTNGHSFVGRATSWYVSGGYRIRQFTPYLTYSALTQEPISDPGLNVATLPASEWALATALNGGLNEVLSTRPVPRTQSAGVRWDFAADLDFKLQCDHIRLGPGSPGTLINTQPGLRPGGTVNVFSAAIDFVF